MSLIRYHLSQTCSNEFFSWGILLLPVKRSDFLLHSCIYLGYTYYLHGPLVEYFKNLLIHSYNFIRSYIEVFNNDNVFLFFLFFPFVLMSSYMYHLKMFQSTILYYLHRVEVFCFIIFWIILFIFWYLLQVVYNFEVVVIVGCFWKH